MTSRADWIPPALLLGIVLAGLPLIGNPSTWATLTVAGLAMGLLIFTYPRDSRWCSV